MKYFLMISMVFLLSASTGFAGIRDSSGHLLSGVYRVQSGSAFEFQNDIQIEIFDDLSFRLQLNHRDGRSPDILSFLFEGSLVETKGQIQNPYNQKFNLVLRNAWKVFDKTDPWYPTKITKTTLVPFGFEIFRELDLSLQISSKPAFVELARIDQVLLKIKLSSLETVNSAFGVFQTESETPRKFNQLHPYEHNFRRFNEAKISLLKGALTCEELFQE